VPLKLTLHLEIPEVSLRRLKVHVIVHERHPAMFRGKWSDAESEQIAPKRGILQCHGRIGNCMISPIKGLANPHIIALDTSLFQCVTNLPSRGIPLHIRSIDLDETSKHILLIPIFLKVGSTQYTCITITVLGYDKHVSFINRKELTHLIFLSTCPRNRLNCLSSCA